MFFLGQQDLSFVVEDDMFILGSSSISVRAKHNQVRVVTMKVLLVTSLTNQAGFGFVGGHVGDVLDVWPNEVVLWDQVGGGRGLVREGYKFEHSFWSLGLFGLVGRRRVLLPHPGSATGHLIAPGNHHTLQHIQVPFGVDIQADFEDVRWHDMSLIWNYTKDHNRCRKLCFHHPGHVPVIRDNPDLHFEGAGNGPVVISWIGREHELYSGESPISLV